MTRRLSTQALAAVLIGCLAAPAAAQPAPAAAQPAPDPAPPPPSPPAGAPATGLVRRRPVPPHVSLEAIRHRQAAEALLAQAKPAEAAVAIREAIRLAGDWPEAWLVSAHVHVALAGPASEVSALAQPQDGVDYAAMLEALRTAAVALETFLRLAPRDPDAPGAQQALALVGQRIALCRQAGAAAAERAARAAAEQQRRSDEEAVRVLAEEARRRQLADDAARAARAERPDADVERERLLAASLAPPDDALARAARRRSALVLLSIGAALGVTAGVFAYLGGATNDRVKDGGFATRADLARELDRGQAYNWTAIGSAALGGLFVAIGTPLLLFNLKVGRTRVALAPSLAPGGAGVTVVLP